MYVSINFCKSNCTSLQARNVKSFYKGTAQLDFYWPVGVTKSSPNTLRGNNFVLCFEGDSVEISQDQRSLLSREHSI